MTDKIVTQYGLSIIISKHCLQKVKATSGLSGVRSYAVDESYISLCLAFKTERHGVRHLVKTARKILTKIDRRCQTPINLR